MSKETFDITDCTNCHFKCSICLGTGEGHYFCGYYEGWLKVNEEQRIVLPDWCRLKSITVEIDNGID
jgi:hypothetical protein